MAPKRLLLGWGREEGSTKDALIALGQHAPRGAEVLHTATLGMLQTILRGGVESGSSAAAAGAEPKPSHQQYEWPL